VKTVEVVKTVGRGRSRLDAEGAALSGEAVVEDGEDGGIAPDSTPGAAVSDRPHRSLEEPRRTLARRVRRTSDATGSTSTRDDRKKFEKHKKSFGSRWGVPRPRDPTSSPSDGLGGPVGPHVRHSADQRVRKTRKTVPRASGEVLDHFYKSKTDCAM
jgi:hypothetical protein